MITTAVTFIIIQPVKVFLNISYSDYFIYPSFPKKGAPLKKLLLAPICGSLFFITSCSNVSEPVSSEDDQQITAELNSEIAQIMEIHSQAEKNPQKDYTEQFAAALKKFDEKYNSNLADDFKNQSAKTLAKRTVSSGGDFPLLTDLPLQNDGDIYLCGGGTDAVGIIIQWVCPTATSGKYYHGACLDIDRFDPTNLESACFQTAFVSKGAGYETPIDWMGKPNVAVTRYNGNLNSESLNSVQEELDYYCDPNNTNMKYGFFENYANIFSIVTKSDNYYWYCTKVVWRIFNALGIQVDSNSPMIDWKTSGLYSIVKAYYSVKYWYSPSKANSAINSYMSKVKNEIVIAEEIYFSNNMIKLYEVVRN